MKNVATKTNQIIKLGLLQRLDLLTLLPKTSSFVKIIIIKDIREKISIKQKDIVDFKIKEIVKDAKMAYNFFIEKPGDDIIDFEFSDIEILELKSILDETSKKQLITENLIPICIELQIK